MATAVGRCVGLEAAFRQPTGQDGITDTHGFGHGSATSTGTDVTTVASAPATDHLNPTDQETPMTDPAHLKHEPGDPGGLWRPRA